MALSMKGLINSGSCKYIQQQNLKLNTLIHKISYKQIKKLLTITGERESAFTADVVDAF